MNIPVIVNSVETAQKYGYSESTLLDIYFIVMVIFLSLLLIALKIILSLHMNLFGMKIAYAKTVDSECFFSYFFLKTWYSLESSHEMLPIGSTTNIFIENLKTKTKVFFY